MIQWMLAIWSLIPLPSKSSFNIWKLTIHILLKPGLENFEYYFTSMWDECNCAVVWAFFFFFLKNVYFCFIDYTKALTVCITTNCGKYLKRWNSQTTWPVSWEICMQVKKQQLELDMDNRMVPNQEKSMSRLYIVTCLFNFYVEYIMQTGGLDEAQTGIKSGEISIISDTQMTSPLWQKAKNN